MPSDSVWSLFDIFASILFLPPNTATNSPDVHKYDELCLRHLITKRKKRRDSPHWRATKEAVSIFSLLTSHAQTKNYKRCMVVNALIHSSWIHAFHKAWNERFISLMDSKPNHQNTAVQRDIGFMMRKYPYIVTTYFLSFFLKIFFVSLCTWMAWVMDEIRCWVPSCSTTSISFGVVRCLWVSWVSLGLFFRWIVKSDVSSSSLCSMFPLPSCN